MLRLFSTVDAKIKIVCAQAMENDVKIVGNGIQEEDSHVLQFLDSMDSYLDLFDALSSKLRQVISLSA